MLNGKRPPAPPAADACDGVNEEIRAFMLARLGRSLWPEEAREYAVLLERWQRAARTSGAGAS
jgi:hypothetical protein